MIELVDFLLSAIAEDEQKARAVSRAPLLNTVVVPRDWKQRAGAEHLNNWMPWRVLAECDAKRQIIEHLQEAAGYIGEWCGRCSFDETPTLKLLALPYRDREGYREEWKP